ncbi:MAG: hypothetical protein PHE02_00745 [Lachnospiraceae bacterium]|nr:hypothetical protein [Lachnospiraceae bacterium]
MISEEFKAEYLNPWLWGHVSDVVEPFQTKRKLFVYECSSGFRVLDETGQHYPEVESLLEEHAWEQDKIEKILKAERSYDVIYYLTKEGIQKFYRRIQNKADMNQDIDAYITWIFQRLKDTPGITVMERNKKQSFLEWLSCHMKGENEVYLLWLQNKGEKVYFNCILEMKNGKLNLVTTSDRYDPEPETFQQCCACVEEEFGKKILAYQFTLQEWEEFVHAEQNEKKCYEPDFL